MIIGEKNGSSLGLFPSPHQYFYPLDEAFNLSFNWFGNGYRNMVDGYGIGIRQDPFGDKRYVPWFNSPPRTKQRLNFFCLPSIGKANLTLEKIKKYTRSDSYAKLDGFKTMQSHFHNEYISNVVLKKLPILEEPNFIKVFKNIFKFLIYPFETGEGNVLSSVQVNSFSDVSSKRGGDGTHSTM